MTCSYRDQQFFIDGHSFLPQPGAKVLKALQIRSRWVVLFRFADPRESRNLYCFADDGKLLWIVEAKVAPVGSIDWSESWQMLFYADAQYIFDAIDLDTGARTSAADFFANKRNIFDPVWTYPRPAPALPWSRQAGSVTLNGHQISLGENLYAASVIVELGQFFVLVQQDHTKVRKIDLRSNLWCFDAQGKKLWEAALRSEWGPAPFVIQYWQMAKKFLVVDVAGKLFAIDPLTGKDQGEYIV